MRNDKVNVFCGTHISELIVIAEAPSVPANLIMILFISIVITLEDSIVIISDIPLLLACVITYQSNFDFTKYRFPFRCEVKYIKLLT